MFLVICRCTCYSDQNKTMFVETTFAGLFLLKKNVLNVKLKTSTKNKKKIFVFVTCISVS